MVKEIEEKDFDEVTKEGKVLVDCFATWCGPCKMLSPVIDKLADEKKDISFYKLDVDNALEVSKKYGIMSIPTLLYFIDGNLVESIVGLRSKSELEEIIK
jgi:thioredoxin 1